MGLLENSNLVLLDIEKVVTKENHSVLTAMQNVHCRADSPLVAEVRTREVRGRHVCIH
jgi:hypothetical protein